jgi:hypothetical protein
LIVFTNVRLRGINSVVALLNCCIYHCAAGLVRLVGRYRKADPVPVGAYEYLLLSGVFNGLLIIWLLVFSVFDRLTYWRIRPGQ